MILVTSSLDWRSFFWLKLSDWAINLVSLSRTLPLASLYGDFSEEVGHQNNDLCEANTRQEEPLNRV